MTIEDGVVIVIVEQEDAVLACDPPATWNQVMLPDSNSGATKVYLFPT